MRCVFRDEHLGGEVAAGCVTDRMTVVRVRVLTWLPLCGGLGPGALCGGS